MILFLDLETFNPEGNAIRNGVYKYAENAEIMLFAYAFDNDPAEVVDLASGECLPERVIKYLNTPGSYVLAHNSNFDRIMLERCLGISHDLCWLDTMILAYSVGLPGALGDLCPVLHIPEDKAKDKEGKRLIQIFCKLNKKGDALVRYGKSTHPEDWAKFVNYARLDVESMRVIFNKLPKFNNQLKFWRQFWLDQKINDRGMCIDRELVNAVVDQCNTVKDDLDEQIRELTHGKIQSARQRAELLEFIRTEYGYNLPDLLQSTISNRIRSDDTPENVRELLVNRLSGSKTSIAKYKVLQDATCSDGRLKGCLQFCGASRTGRFSGRIFQPQNLPRGSLKPAEVETAIEAFKSGSAQFIYTDLNSVASSCLRGAIIAPKGKKLVVADLSNIEGRVLAWVAGESWKLDAFRAYDNGTGPDLYKLTYAKTFGTTPEEVAKPQRQIGKVLELGMGYGGGASAFIAYANGMNLDFSHVADNAYSTLDRETLEKAKSNYQFFVDSGRDMSAYDERIFTAVEAIKIAWRSTNSRIVSLWDDLARAVCVVLAGDAEQQEVGCLTISKRLGYLLVKLPSGRYMCYPAAKRLTDRTLTYWGMNQISKKWVEIETYGGKLVENAIQAIARDILVESMQECENKGYKIILSVHDELITETPDESGYNDTELARIMATPPKWAEGLPLSAAGFCGYRYRKD